MLRFARSQLVRPPSAEQRNCHRVSRTAHAFPSIFTSPQQSENNNNFLLSHPRRLTPRRKQRLILLITVVMNLRSSIRPIKRFDWRCTGRNSRSSGCCRCDWTAMRETSARAQLIGLSPPIACTKSHNFTFSFSFRAARLEANRLSSERRSRGKKLAGE